jgi:hypothetical protein
MPAKCVSSVSPRFHYRRLAFCFLPLAAILEFSPHLLYLDGITGSCGKDNGIPRTQFLLVAFFVAVFEIVYIHVLKVKEVRELSRTKVMTPSSKLFRCFCYFFLNI